MASIKEQVEACISGTKFDLVRKYVSHEPLSADDYKKVFTVSPKEVKEYLVSNYELIDLIRVIPNLADGFYAIEQSKGRWLTYSNERNIHFDECEVNSISEAWDRYIEKGLGVL